MQNRNPFSTFGPDINEYKSNVNFEILARNSDFIYLRSSGSATGRFRIDKKFIEFAKGCRQYGIPSGAYHFGVPSADVTTADSQCDEFIKTLQLGYGEGDYGDLFPVIDVEVPVNKSITTVQLLNWVDRFRKRFEKNTRRRLMIYTGSFFIKLYDDFKLPNGTYPLKDMPLWIAMYTEIPGNPPYPEDAGGWKRWTIWQYTEKGNLKGVDPPVDLNWGPNSLDLLMPPRKVQGLYATMDKNRIYVSWKKNSDVDLLGYNIFVNSNYAGTVGKNTTSFTIDKNKFYLPLGKQIEISIEAFDTVGDFSKERAKFVIRNTREDEFDRGMYLGNNFLFMK